MSITFLKKNVTSMCRKFHSESEMFAEIIQILKAKDLISDESDVVVLTGGLPLGQPNAANFIRILNGNGSPAA
jgi:organic radical activating enzyme